MANIEVTLTIDPIPAPIVTDVNSYKGPAGLGLPPGGAIGQVLIKASGTDYDTTWTQLSQQMTKQSITTLSGHKAVAIDSNDKAYYADKNTAQNVIGITLNAGTELTIQTAGEIIEPSWTWIPNQAIYLGNDGELTQTVPTDGYLIKLGEALTTTSIFVSIAMPIFLA